MDFLSPASIAIAAGLTVPPLIALYFLKLKRTVKYVPTTLLWRKAVEDLQVNAPFQRLRGSLLLLLQLLVLLLAALALGEPMFETARRHEGTSIILIDRSASMNVVEEDGRSRLEIAKEQAKRTVDNLAEDARAMVIEFCDAANVVSSFDADKQALKRKIDSIQSTQSTTSLREALSLAEAYTQNIMIGTEEAGADIAPESSAPPASVFIFSDGRIEDTDRVAIQRLDLERMTMTPVGRRGDNVGILAMDARRNYETPELLEVTATVRNFGPEPVTVDAVLYIEDRTVDVQTITLEGASAGPDATSARAGSQARAGSVRAVAFDIVEFGGGGLVQVMLRIDDALAADDRAWTILPPPRDIRVLLVSPGNLFLENALATLPIDVAKMGRAAYERAADEALQAGDRSVYDLVIFDRHSTARLPRGSYLFFGGAPLIEGVEATGIVEDEIIFNWDETHPVLRHVTVETLYVYQWLGLKLPPETKVLIEGQTTPVLAYVAREGSQYLISAFSPIVEDATGRARMNTFWVATVDFVVFMQNAVQYLGSNIATTGRNTLLPGEPATLPLPPETASVRVLRPDGETETATTSGQILHYARTQHVGPYRIEPGEPGSDLFAVNLFNATESDVAPAPQIVLGAQPIQAQAGTIEVNEPAWPYLLLAVLVLLILEWIVYNRRVFV